MKNTHLYGSIALLLGGIACFAYFLSATSYHLIHKEQTLLFVYTAEALSSYLDKPAVLSCLAGNFLTQFFASPVVASVLLSVLIFLIGLAVFSILRRWINCWVALGLAGVVMAWEVVRACSLIYPVSSTVSLLGGCVLFLIYIGIKRKEVRIAVGFVGMLLGYWLFGYGAFVFLLFVLIETLTGRKDILWVPLMAIVLVAGVALLSKTYLLTYPQAYSYPSTTWWEKPNPLYEHLLALDIEGHAGHWDKVKALSFPDPRISAYSYYYNLANASEGKLPDGLMKYYQPGPEGLFMPISANSSYISSLYAAEVWFHLGDMTMAEHATILGMIFSPNHRGSRMIQRLTEINLINGDNEAAMKYLRILSNTLFYKDWAKEHIPGKESPAVAKWLKEKRALIPQSDTVRTSTMDIARSLRLLLAANPDNRMARDYLLCYHLLLKDIPSFLEDYVAPDGQAPCRLYAEALMIDLVRRQATGDEIRQAIVNPAVVQDFKEYTRLHQQSKGNPQALVGKYGQTYWFYYHFAQNQ